MPTFVPDEIVTAAKLNRLNRINLATVESTDQTVTSTTFIAGSPVCGVTFTAAETAHWVSIFGFLVVTPSAASQRRIMLGWELRTGSTIGSGTVVIAADALMRSVSLAGSLSGDSMQSGVGGRWLMTGLTVATVYNVATVQSVNNNTTVTAQILERMIGVE